MQQTYFDRESRAIADVMQSSLVHNSYMITRINVPVRYRSKGLGSQLLRQIIADADDLEVDLILLVSPSGGLSFDELVNWYQRYGFTTPDPNLPGYMVKTPNYNFK